MGDKLETKLPDICWWQNYWNFKSFSDWQRYLSVAHGLSAWRAPKDKVKRPEGPPARSKGPTPLQLVCEGDLGAIEYTAGCYTKPQTRTSWMWGRGYALLQGFIETKEIIFPFFWKYHSRFRVVCCDNHDKKYSWTPMTALKRTTHHHLQHTSRLSIDYQLQITKENKLWWPHHELQKLSILH